jgi:DNA helicase-2/ATP-dependent DNA helicase PcrA
MKILEMYTKKMREYNAIDYNDMLLLVINKLKEDKSLLFQIRRRFTHLLVDEYQVDNVFL